MSISLSERQRQRQSRYVIHAGWNLPNKRFRYLRTVRVTAAIRYYLYSVLKTPPFRVIALGRRQTKY